MGVFLSSTSALKSEDEIKPSGIASPFMKNRIAIKCPLVSFVVSLVVTRLLATSSSSSSIAWDIKPIGHKVMRKERKDFIGFIAILNCIPCTTTTFFSPFPKFSIHKLKD